MNLLNVWILSRLVGGVTAALLCITGAVVGARVALRWRAGNSSEEQLRLEQGAELSCVAVQIAAALSIVGIGHTVLMADRLVGNIRGAMCAFGVFASARHGFHALIAGYFSAVACSLWIVLHRLDMRLPSPVLTRGKCCWLLLLTPLIVGEICLLVTFALNLDFSVIASCCSVWVDDSVIATEAAFFAMPPEAAAAIGLPVVLAALAASVYVWRRPGRAASIAAAAGSWVAPFAALPAIFHVVAPHALGTPSHPCPFCILRAQAGGIGWPLYLAVFSGHVLGMGIGVVEAHRKAAADPVHVNGVQNSLGLGAAIGWGCALVFGTYPVAKYVWDSGGVFVYGGIQ